MFSKLFEYMVIFFQIHVLHFLNDNKHFIKLHEHSFTWFNIFKFAYTFSNTCHVYSVKVMTHFFTTCKHFFTLYKKCSHFKILFRFQKKIMFQKVFAL